MLRKPLPLFLLALALVAPPAASLGLTPNSAHLDNVLRGGYAKIPFFVTNTENVATVFSVRVTGPAAPWSAVLPSSPFQMGPRETRKMELLVQPPPDAAAGGYEAGLVVESESLISVTGRAVAKANTGIEGKIIVSLTNEQKLSLSIESVETSVAEEKTPAFLSITAKNDGNVRAKPEIIARLVDGKNRLVTEVRKGDYEVLPTEEAKLEMQLPTEELEPGDYDLHVAVILGGKEVFSRALRQSIVGRGELSTQGQVVSVEVPPWAEAGTFVKVTVVFENTGATVSTAEVTGEVALDGQIVELLSGRPVKVSPGEQVALNAFFKPARAGRHSVKAGAFFGGRPTGFVEAIVNVTPATAAAGANESLYYALAAIVLLAGAGYAFRDKLPEVRVKGN